MRRLSSLLVYIAIVAVVCGGDDYERDDGPYDSPPPAADLVTDYAGLFGALEDGALDPVDGGVLQQPFLSVSPRVISTTYGDVQVFEYVDDAAMEADAKKISADGFTFGGTLVGWVDVPHVFKNGRVIALYVGANNPITNALRGALGEQFAGG